MTTIPQNETEKQVNNNQANIDALRKMADFLEARPDFPKVDFYSANVWVWTPEEFKVIARQMGTATKKATDYSFTVRKTFGNGINLDLNTSREKVCRRVVTGKKPVEKKVMRELSEEEQAVYDSFFEVQTEEQDVIAWECEPAFVLAEPVKEEVAA